MTFEELEYFWEIQHSAWGLTNLEQFNQVITYVTESCPPLAYSKSTFITDGPIVTGLIVNGCIILVR